MTILFFDGSIIIIGGTTDDNQGIIEIIQTADKRVPGEGFELEDIPNIKSLRKNSVFLKFADEKNIDAFLTTLTYLKNILHKKIENQKAGNE
jgi:hypothetical protein